MYLQHVVERTVVFCVRKEWHLVPLVVKSADFLIVAYSEKHVRNLRAVAEGVVSGEAVHERLLVRQDVVADTQLLQFWDLAELLLDELRVREDFLDDEPVQQNKTLLCVETLEIDFLVVHARQL